MKYQHLTQICNYLQQFKKIDFIKRVHDNLILISFDNKNLLFFDMNKQCSCIYKNPNFIQSKIYKAPFDIILAKRLNSSKIDHIYVPQNNRILIIKCSQSGSYKKSHATIYFEFTGRFTNVIITDENSVILEALGHYENSLRIIKPSKILTMLEPIDIKEKSVEQITDFERFFLEEFHKINDEKLLNLKQNKISDLQKKISTLRSNLATLESSQSLNQKADELILRGECIMANLYKLKDYDKAFTLEDFSGKVFSFKNSLPPKFEAASLFKEAKKLRQKAKGSGVEELNLNQKLQFHLNLMALVSGATTKEEVELFFPKRQNSGKNSDSSDYTQSFYLGEFKIIVGKNEKGNALILKNARKNDWWFHLKDMSSTHVIVKTNKQNLSDDIVKFAAKICVNFSCKFSGVYEVDYTKRENVRIIEGAFVNYTNYLTTTALKD